MNLLKMREMGVLAKFRQLFMKKICRPGTNSTAVLK